MEKSPQAEGIIDKSSIVPIYYQLKEYIKDQIKNGVWKAEELIPSERELTEQFQINRMTVRQSITELVHEGFLRKQRGVGTFVTQPPSGRSLAKLTSFSTDILNLKPGSRLLAMNVIPAPQKTKEQLGLSDELQIIEIIRIRTADNEPIALEQVHLIYDKASPLLNENFENRSIYKILEEVCGYRLTRVAQTIEIAACTPEEAAHLDIDPTDAALLMERVTYLENGEPIEFARCIYRADRYELT